MTYRARVARGGLTRTKVFLTKADAKAWGVKADAELARMAGGLRQQLTLNEAWAKYRTTRLQELKSQKDYIQRMAFWLAMLGHCRIDKITLGAIEEAVDALQCSGPTKNRYMAVLQAVLTFGGNHSRLSRA